MVIMEQALALYFLCTFKNMIARYVSPYKMKL